MAAGGQTLHGGEERRTHVTPDRLPAAWLATLRRVSARGDLAGAGARVLSAWAQPHRAYHDLRHLTETLNRVDALAAHAEDPDAVRLAAWLHDVVYEPTRPDNEERSAAYGQRLLAELAVPGEIVAEVGRLVRLTAGHASAPDDANGAVLCDADLAVLAADPERYAEYAADVRREYAHVPAEAYAAGRAAVLRSLLERPALYRCPPAREWEARARANMRAELSRLAGDG
jgi:predicted metal-dependent HD superfamily phosphohydrolase